MRASGKGSTNASLKRPSFNQRGQKFKLHDSEHLRRQNVLQQDVPLSPPAFQGDPLTPGNTEEPFNGSIRRSQREMSLHGNITAETRTPRLLCRILVIYFKRFSACVLSSLCFSDHTDHHRLRGQNPKDLGWEAASRHLRSDRSVLLRFACSECALLYTPLLMVQGFI